MVRWLNSTPGWKPLAESIRRMTTPRPRLQSTDVSEGRPRQMTVPYSLIHSPCRKLRKSLGILEQHSESSESLVWEFQLLGIAYADCCLCTWWSADARRVILTGLGSAKPTHKQRGTLQIRNCTIGEIPLELKAFARQAVESLTYLTFRGSPLVGHGFGMHLHH